MIKLQKIVVIALSVLLFSQVQAKEQGVSVAQKKWACKHVAAQKSKEQRELKKIDTVRLESYNIVADKLACLSDQQIQELVSHDTEWQSGYGKTATIDIDGVLVFVKKIPLTSLEQEQGNVRSTANIFNLPLFYQYGVGSAGFGAWRELAALMMASNWVLTNSCKNFPLLYHWRIVNNDIVPNKSDKIDKKVTYWNNSSAVGNRLKLMNQATSSIVVFSECFPMTLHSFLMQKSKEEKHAFDKAVKMAERDLQEAALFMADHGMLHFDMHSENIMTDGHRLYCADFGLATASLFDLSVDEKAFLAEHQNYDQIYVQADLVFNILESLQFDEQAAIAQLQKYVDGCTSMTHSPYITFVLRKYARAALLFDEFTTNLRKKSKLTPYPAAEIANIVQAGKCCKK